MFIGKHGFNDETVSMQIKGTNHIAIICSDRERALTFYCDVLGCQLLDEEYRQERDSWLIRLSMNGTYLIELFTFPSSPARLSYPEACGLRHMAFEVEDLEVALAELDAKGVAHEEMRAVPDGTRCCFLHDPDGLPIELVETPK